MEKNTMIIFDLDGTLWDATEITYKCVNYVLKKCGLPLVSKEVIINTFGCSFEEAAENYMPKISKKSREKVMEKINMTTFKVIEQKGGAKLYMGIKPILKKLNTKYKLGIVSNGAEDYVKAFIDMSKTKDLFVDYIGTTDSGITKAKAIERMKKNNNAKYCIFVGDTEKDKEAALKADVGFIHARYGFQKDLESNYHISSFSEIEDVISSCERAQFQ